MKFYKAKVADVLRLHQRDELFIMDAEQKMHLFLKLMGSGNYHRLNSSISTIARVWYYFMTSMEKLQTLGEEYTGTIRSNTSHQIPSKSLSLLWLILHVGGEPMFDRILNYSKKKILASQDLRSDVKSLLLKCIAILKEEKSTLKRIHNALFYMDGRYYNISNRVTGIQYVLLRQWLEDDTFTGSFSILGNLSLFYVLLSFVMKMFIPSSSYNTLESEMSAVTSKKGCILCAENIKSACSTPCGHIFCWNCIYESLQYQKNCPICREEVNSSRIIFLQNFI
ncbi:peroxisome biogenesis factor 10-like [Diabrotica virgifera virgifera]|uniref:RING-type E3 ubiquitin transferase n=1 Tax=Diabrotica virgifera virgifera TaxID=50390 RepID=A0A6P7GJ28_DIAVI|nr:peroxisome biogenesis factor 10-like [Diabrotica virgifera virgifera]